MQLDEALFFLAHYAKKIGSIFHLCPIHSPTQAEHLFLASARTGKGSDTKSKIESDRVR
jgi:hypothetical protein